MYNFDNSNCLQICEAMEILRYCYSESKLCNHIGKPLALFNKEGKYPMIYQFYSKVHTEVLEGSSPTAKSTAG
jgi:hypothetical protein